MCLSHQGKNRIRAKDYCALCSCYVEAVQWVEIVTDGELSETDVIISAAFGLVYRWMDVGGNSDPEKKLQIVQCARQMTSSF